MPVDKHINFFELQKVCAKKGCPLCRLVNDRAWRYLDNMLFEHVSDRGFRAKYRASGGFCAEHSRKLEGFRDGLAVAILGRDTLADRVAGFRKRAPWRPKAACPICVERSRIEDEYLGFLAGCTGDSAEERELRTAFESSEGLCAPHYSALAARKGKLPDWLSDLHDKKFTQLLERTARFIEYSAYGRQDDFAKLSIEDQVVWKELARNLRGTVDMEELND